MKYIDFFQKAINIKKIERTGWQYKKIPEPESVADHSFGVVLLALTIPLPNHIDRNELIKMATIHDIGEHEIGDMVWENGKITHKKIQKSKHKSEFKVLNELFNDIDNKELLNLSMDFLHQKSETAKFLKEIDKLEMIFQALKYENSVDPSSLDEFWENAEKYIKTKEVKDIFEKLKLLRAD